MKTFAIAAAMVLALGCSSSPETRSGDVASGTSPGVLTCQGCTALYVDMTGTVTHYECTYGAQKYSMWTQCSLPCDMGPYEACGTGGTLILPCSTTSDAGACTSCKIY